MQNVAIVLPEEQAKELLALPDKLRQMQDQLDDLRKHFKLQKFVKLAEIQRERLLGPSNFYTLKNLLDNAVQKRLIRYSDIDKGYHLQDVLDYKRNYLTR